MFSKDKTAGRVVCLEDYGRVKKGAIVPASNELYADVEDWLAEGNELAEFDGYPEIPMSEEQLQEWRESAVVTRRQGKQQLLADGLLVNVQPTIDAISDETQRGMVQIFWDDATEFERKSPELNQLGADLGLSDEQIDELFRNASQR
ncbi:hypothetical protein [Halomonas sp. hl-4]|uniref:hypothetical protein n=1 Tax=Halomonas sp. hl-4 TaxID=1761789 RepID=UPI000BB93BF1|nr:hypothetical protein [Halomonas sp. hl-4]SNY95576.1 hypothetical protein SAMN04488142_0077 [Halomonas sp. hl-4]